MGLPWDCLYIDPQSTTPGLIGSPMAVPCVVSGIGYCDSFIEVYCAAKLVASDRSMKSSEPTFGKWFEWFGRCVIGCDGILGFRHFGGLGACSAPSGPHDLHIWKGSTAQFT